MLETCLLTVVVDGSPKGHRRILAMAFFFAEKVGQDADYLHSAEGDRWIISPHLIASIIFVDKAIKKGLMYIHKIAIGTVFVVKPTPPSRKDTLSQQQLQ